MKNNKFHLISGDKIIRLRPKKIIVHGSKSKTQTKKKSKNSIRPRTINGSRQITGSRASKDITNGRSKRRSYAENNSSSSRSSSEPPRNRRSSRRSSRNRRNSRNRHSSSSSSHHKHHNHNHNHNHHNSSSASSINSVPNINTNDANTSISSHGCKNCYPEKRFNQNIVPNNPYGLYSKGLPHDSDGYVYRNAFIQFYKALKNQDVDILNNVTLGGTLKLTDLSAAWSKDTPKIVCRQKFRLPKLDTATFGAELVELYCMSTVRDVSFVDYSTNGQITNCINDMLLLTEYSGPLLSANTIFRGQSSGDLVGPYISQLLYLDYLEGGVTYQQLYAPQNNIDYMVTLPNALSCINGTVNEVLAPLLPLRYIINGRDLASYVHRDEPFQAFFRAMCVIYKQNIPYNTGFPTFPSSAGFVNIGKADVQTCLGEVTRLALLGAWCQKIRALFARPEEVGVMVHRVKAGLNTLLNPIINQEILNNPILNDIFANYATYLLPQAYPEGAPTHPSYPSGHATIAGACITVLKYFFNGQWPMALLQPDNVGANLVPSGFNSTLSGELDKLASNIAFGRNFAGIHYRMDAIAGIHLGELIGLNYIRNHVKKYPYKISIQITLYNGSSSYITN